MKCPSCLWPLLVPAPQCPHCQLTLRELDIEFGAVPRHSALLTDRTGRLPAGEVRELRALLRSFHARFPQSLFSVFIANQLPGPIAEYTFWIANRGRFGPAHNLGSDNFDLHLGVDVDACAAALMIGYGLEHYLTEQDLEWTLAAAFDAFHHRDFGRAIRICIELMTERMKNLVKALEQAGSSPPPDENL
jgi:uncharacterized protein (DUF3820 family)